MIRFRRLCRFFLPSCILVATVLISAACASQQPIRPTPTFILDGSQFTTQLTNGIQPGNNGQSEPLFLPVVSGGEEEAGVQAESTVTLDSVTGTATHTPGVIRTSTLSSTPRATVTPAPTGTNPTATPTRWALDPTGTQLRFAIIGDYGTGGANADGVAEMVRAWEPDIILTTGDNNLPSGAAETIDSNVGRLFHDFIFPYDGGYGAGADFNRFFPALGAHDWITDQANPHFNYFTLPGNERYYEFTYGPAHFIALDSDAHEPDGIYSDSPQAAWSEEALSRSTSCWQFVYFFHPAYSSGQDGSSIWMQWPFASWGVDTVFSGRDRHYERLEIDGIPYFVNGLGGNTITPFSAIQPGSQIRYNDDFGAMLVTTDQDTAIFEFYNANEDLIDYHVVEGGCR